MTEDEITTELALPAQSGRLEGRNEAPHRLRHGRRTTVITTAEGTNGGQIDTDALPPKEEEGGMGNARRAHEQDQEDEASSGQSDSETFNRGTEEESQGIPDPPISVKVAQKR